MKTSGCLAILILLLTGGLLLRSPVRQPAPSPTVASSCPTEKIAFTQATGCQNDGSVEFCLPADDPAALDTVRQIAPEVSCQQAGGRAHCDLNTQILCLVETRGMCVAEYGALTDAGWQTVCDLAALPFVKQIVPTWYE